MQETDDLVNILKQSPMFDSAAKPHAAVILGSEQFQRWITVCGSELIHVDGHLDSSRFGKTSPISYFCAMLVQVFRDVAMDVTLHFFCGQHVAAVDDLKGPRGLISSLIKQLVLAIHQNQPNDPLNANLTSFGGCHKSIPTKDICQVFQHLLKQIPAHVTVFCFIDDITRLERDSWFEDYTSLMEMLNGAMYNQGIGAKLKVLMTSPTKSRWLKDKLTPAQHVELRGSGRFIGAGTEQSMWRGVRRELRLPDPGLVSAGRPERLDVRDEFKESGVWI